MTQNSIVDTNNQSKTTTTHKTTTLSGKVKRRRQFEKMNNHSINSVTSDVKTAEKKFFLFEDGWTRQRDAYWKLKSYKEFMEFPNAKNAKNHKKWHRNHREEIYQLRNNACMESLPQNLYV
ncbi:hypothetical protein FDP41_008679 [Naegleria fowleri]|uniref:Uncharacterized protein n=1 Tax=Naegleria fowleri TaxID=5763 RepID=A0A6A5BG89_NAEFO|nr:uncharacterized protein FDP41_008679 [Naegleria fowleri]KAF0973015.1 hypothetical protein FDP41_008679 [Naegleria fowleri]